jgi:hypothetical protein
MEPARHWRVDQSLTFSLGVYRGKTMLIGVLVTFLVVILILYLINLLPLDGRAKQIVRVIVIILGVLSLLKYIAVF